MKQDCRSESRSDLSDFSKSESVKIRKRFTNLIRDKEIEKRIAQKVEFCPGLQKNTIKTKTKIKKSELNFKN